MYKRFVALLICFFACVTALAQQADLANKLSQFQTLEVATGSFVQKKYFKVLSQPIISKGQIFFDQNVGLLWQTQQPVFSEMIIKQNELTIDDGMTSKSIENASAISNVMLSAVSGNYQLLSESFSIHSANDSSCVKLKAKDEQLKVVIERIELCGSKQLEQITIFEVSGNHTEIIVSLNALPALPEAISDKLH